MIGFTRQGKRQVQRAGSVELSHGAENSSQRHVTIAALGKPGSPGESGLHEAWTLAMTQLAWRTGESDDDYKKRVALPYDDFKARIEGIRTIVAVVEKHTEPARAAKGSAKSKPKPQSKAKTS